MANKSDKHRIETKVVHTGYDPEHDIMQSIHLSTTFKRKAHDQPGEYTRTSNPNRATLEAKLSMLEGGADAIAFSSGMAAVHALFENILTPGSHLIYPDDCYHGTRALLKNVFAKKNVTATEVDMSSVDKVAAAIKPETKLIWLESPSNPKLKVTDIQAMAELGKSKKILTACDSTFATPLFQRPLELGMDFVMHSSTKFFSGHSDVLGGVIISREKSDVSNQIRSYQGVAGAVPSPFDCWLLCRSISTFTLRVAAQAANAQTLAEYLAKHPKIELVMYPGLPSHPGHDIAKKQMKGGFGSVMSILVKGGRNEALALVDKLELLQHATSLGGVESLIEHRRTAEGAMMVSPENLLRISIGIEHIDDIIADFEQALK